MNLLIKPPVYSLFTAFFFTSTVQSHAQPFEYKSLKHKTFIASVRAGTHDDKGENLYFFTHTVTAIRNDSKQAGKEVEDRETISLETQEFAEVEVPSLKLWDEGEKNEDLLHFSIPTDDIRSLVAKAMRKFSVKENEVGVKVSVKVYERGKWLYFFGEDTFIGEVEYFPLTISEYQVASRTNLKLNVTDDFGATIVVKVKYEMPITNTTENPKSEK